MKSFVFTLVLGLCTFAMQTHAQEAAKALALPGSYRNLSVEDFDKLRKETNAVVLDVRTVKEYNAGHIPGAINIDVNSPTFTNQLGKMDKSKTYLVHCAAGVRSVRACKELVPLQFTNLFNLKEGYVAWEKAGKPTEK